MISTNNELEKRRMRAKEEYETQESKTRRETIGEPRQPPEEDRSDCELNVSGLGKVGAGVKRGGDDRLRWMNWIRRA